jgi:hypothetical protein
VAILQLVVKDGRWSATVTATARGFSAAVEDVTVEQGVLRGTLKLDSTSIRLEFPVPREKGARMTGSILKGGNADAAELEPTTLTSLDEYDLARERVAREKGGYEVVQLALGLLSRAAEKKAKPEEVRGWAAKAVKAAEAYGAPWHRTVVLETAEILNGQKGFESIALTYARQAERLVEARDPPTYRKRVLDTLAASLVRAGKEDEAKEVRARADKVDFSIKFEPYPGRKGKSERVVLVEMFTSSELPAGVAAEQAFDALGKTFKPSEAVRLQYHLDVRGRPDPLSSTDAVERVRSYAGVLESVPGLLFNGQAAGLQEGGREEAPAWYRQARAKVEPLLETPAKASVKATATRKGEKLDIDVEASAAEGTGEQLRLRLALVEEQLAYAGANKVPQHYNVVRAFAGSVEGEKVAAGKPLRKAVSVDLAAVRKKLMAYLDEGNPAPFPGKERLFDLKKLRVVAFVQNDATREVLQAVQVEVSD